MTGRSGGVRPWTRAAWGAFAAAALAAAALAGGCASGAAPAADPVKPARKAPSSFDPCAGQPPPAKEYLGVLREAKCEQDMFLTMAATAEALGVTCGHCHLQKAGGGPKDFDFPPMTRNKEVANWMKHQLVDRLRHKDGSPVTCASCHVGKDGKRSARFLGEPRDQAFAMEWMSLVMVNEFTKADGSKLRCKDCHAAPPSVPAFERKLILSRDLVGLPVRTDLPPPGRQGPAPVPAEAGMPAPAESVDPAAGPAAPPAPPMPPPVPPPPGPGPVAPAPAPAPSR